LKKLKQYIIIGAILYALYFILSHHIIFHGRDFFLLNKEKITLEYTFYSIKSKSPEKILEIDVLRDAGIGAILVELGTISEEKRYDIENSVEWKYE
jgi:hypothetical protein